MRSAKTKDYSEKVSRILNRIALIDVHEVTWKQRIRCLFTGKVKIGLRVGSYLSVALAQADKKVRK